MASSTLEQLAATISADVTAVTQLLHARGEPAPSFAESNAVTIGEKASTNSDTTLLQARNRLINAAHDLLRLAQGPVDHVVTLAYGVSIVPIR
jgi:6-hydroxytryprostatin B O-methyltransferase